MSPPRIQKLLLTKMLSSDRKARCDFCYGIPKKCFEYPLPSEPAIIMKGSRLSGGNGINIQMDGMDKDTPLPRVLTHTESTKLMGSVPSIATGNARTLSNHHGDIYGYIV